MSVQMAKKPLTGLTVLRGKNLPQLISKLESEIPVLFGYHAYGDEAFIASLGAEEYLINHPKFSHDLLESEQYAFQRGDVIITLSGNWRALMSEVCIYDFRQANPGDFAMVLIAGVSVWMLIPVDGDAVTLGCDPTYGEYLIETLENQINTSPFLI